MKFSSSIAALAIATLAQSAAVPQKREFDFSSILAAVESISLTPSESCDIAAALETAVGAIPTLISELPKRHEGSDSKGQQGKPQGQPKGQTTGHGKPTGKPHGKPTGGKPHGKPTGAPYGNSTAPAPTPAPHKRHFKEIEDPFTKNCTESAFDFEHPTHTIPTSFPTLSIPSELI